MQTLHISIAFTSRFTYNYADHTTTVIIFFLNYTCKYLIVSIIVVMYVTLPVPPQGINGIYTCEVLLCVIYLHIKLIIEPVSQK